MAQNHTSTTNSAVTIDACGLNCPLPVLKLRKRLKELAPGAEVELVATDRAALKDVPAFCAAQGHALLTVGEEGVRLRFRVRKSAG